MAESLSIQSVLFTLVTVFWVFVDLAVAGVVFYRFRATAAGILVGGGHVLLSLKNVMHLLVFSLLFRFIHPEMDVHMMAELLIRVVSLCIYLIIGLGLAFIPMSLSKIAAKSPVAGT